jgi:hypothetical protein
VIGGGKGWRIKARREKTGGMLFIVHAGKSRTDSRCRNVLKKQAHRSAAGVGGKREWKKKDVNPNGDLTKRFGNVTQRGWHFLIPKEGDTRHRPIDFRWKPDALFFSLCENTRMILFLFYLELG